MNFRAVAALAATFCCVALAAQAPPVAPLVVDVQVIDRDGRPIPAITADKFEVEVAGRRRRVISAELIPAASATTADSEARQQTYFVAIDALSFGPGASSLAISAIKTFLTTLPPGSRVGLVTVPDGPAVEQTTDTAAIVKALDALVGQRQPQRWGSLGVSAADVVEYLSANDRSAIIQRFCGTEEDTGCPGVLDQEVTVGVNSLETQIRTSLGLLGQFVGRLGAIPGRKVLVLASAGIPAADRTGGRPDATNLATDLASAATRSDASVYTLYLDRLGEPDRAENARQAASAARDRDLLPRWLDQFSSSMGGALVRVQPDQKTEAFERIARETSMFYRLRIESAPADRVDRAQRLRVRVDQRGATIRSRTQIATK